jgi:hypothetical protein
MDLIRDAPVVGCARGGRSIERNGGYTNMRAGKPFRTLLSLAVAVGGLAVAAPAWAQNPPPEVLLVPPVVIVNPLQPDTATVVGVYRCFGGEPIHLWVSAKQGGPDPSAEGAGFRPTAQGGAVAWYDTNVLEAPPVNCDGQYHAAVVPIGQHPEKARLTSGPAWIQFCLVASDPETGGIIASQQKFGTVVGALDLQEGVGGTA